MPDDKKHRYYFLSSGIIRLTFQQSLWKTKRKSME